MDYVGGHMSIDKQINDYFASQPEPKRADMRELHRAILSLMPKGKLWFMDGKDGSGKTVSNPSVGYGTQTMKYANGDTREFYQIGIRQGLFVFDFKNVDGNTGGICAHANMVELP